MIYDDNEWKRCKEEPEAGRTRAAEQSFIDVEYANGRMTHEEWNRRTDELSDAAVWNAAGKITKTNTK